MKQRQKVIPKAKGRVLEIGVGSGLNFSFYNAESVDELIGLDPSPEMIKIAKSEISKSKINTRFIQAFAEEIPVDSASIDSVVITYTLCSIPDTSRTLQEIHRVLKPDGQLIFCEHGAAPDPNIRRQQDLLTPMWSFFGGGCRLNKNIGQLIGSENFHIADLQTMYIPGFKPACFNYWGTATPG